MAENKILPWAQTSTANALSDADYAADVATGGTYVDGVKSGQASSKQANKTWRQATAPGAGLGQFLVDNLSVDVTDADTPSTFSTRIANAILKLAQVSPFNQSWATATGGYRKYAIVSDSSGNFWVSTADQNTTVPGADGANWQSLFNGYITESTADNRYVKKSGDTSIGTQYSTQFFSGGFGGGWNGARTNTGDYGWTNGLAFGNPANDGKYRGTWTVTDVLNNGSSNSSGLNLTGYDAGGTTYQWYFAWNGKVTTPGGVLAFESDLSGYVANTNPGISGALTVTSLCVNPSDGRSYLAYSGNTKIASLAWYSDVVSEATSRTNADNNLQAQISSKQPAGAYIECPNGNKLIAFQIPSVKFVEGGTYVAFPNGGFSGMPVSIVSTTNADNDMDTMTFNWSKEGFYINIPSQTNSQNNPVSIMAVGPA